ncbi:cell division ATP-binding protein FtsE [Candidatus Gottesmanbacteria bacterium RIFCSPHIGHO2_01_FULL_42_12]|uniref:Cell division ATP-binding protein FtsE n=1 Tax=Candidatus Gottesmanbacteria bacterium RIFCSPHIGHO2_01_FULL_42_12 TaxID=1798377 RepID=A0A1F5Z0K1_9BACT|nr:MAG: cell division ATP-binding protein FtsE [Candidatus Gottesmanbacteria bacterium RIFCSPHIGHO2_01_FULL_42_12]
MIKLQNLTKKFPDGTVALADINFEINDGEFIFIVGPSGAGKTTLFKLLDREYLSDTGSIIIDDKDLGKLKGQEIVKHRRHLGIVFQDLKLLLTKNVFENIALTLEVAGVKEKEIKERVNAVLSKVDLANFAFQFPAQLSGGELQRVAIARAIVTNPKYVIADEPTGNVDPANVWSIMKLLKLINDSGTTVIVATHNVEVVDMLDKRVIRLENGRMVKDKKGKYR